MIECCCPYCNHIFNEDIEDYNESTDYEAECPNCNKVFGFNIYISVSSSSYELICGGQTAEDDSKHAFEPVVGYPKEYFENRKRCKYCGLEINEKDVVDKVV